MYLRFMHLPRFLTSLFALLLLFTGSAQEEIIDSTEIVQLDGYQHFVSYKGQKDQPVLLILHGGPGKSLMGAADMFNDQLIQNFLVVHWDQRMSDKGLELNPNQTELSMELLHKDTEQIIDYLLKKCGRQKLFLASHSWGSETGFEFARKHPEKLHAFIAISPVIDQKKNTELTIAMLKDWAKENENKEALTELDSVNVPLQTKSDLFYQQKWLFIHNDVGFAKLPSFRATYFGWMDTWFPLVYQQGQESLLDRYDSFDCPIVILEGKGDGMEVHDFAKHFYKHIDASKKHFVWFKKSGHTVFNTEPEKLQKVIVKMGRRYANN